MFRYIILRRRHEIQDSVNDEQFGGIKLRFQVDGVLFLGAPHHYSNYFDPEGFKSSTLASSLGVNGTFASSLPSHFLV